jgi:hypothetical protein
MFLPYYFVCVIPGNTPARNVVRVYLYGIFLEVLICFSFDRTLASTVTDFRISLSIILAASVVDPAF